MRELRATTELRRRQARRAIDNAERATRASTAACARTRWGGVQILLVEDDQSIQAATAALLIAKGYRIHVAMHGENALRYLRREGLPSLIILDYQMPVMDGLQFRAQQATDPDLASVPVVVCSAQPEPPDLTWPLAVDEWLRKPVDPRTLVDTVRKYVLPV